MFEVDFSEVQDAFELIPNGQYVGYVTDVEVKKKEGSQYPYWNWRLTISEGKFRDRSVYMTTSLNPSILWRLKKMLSTAFHVDSDVLRGKVQIERDELLGVRVGMVLQQETYNGKTNSKCVDLIDADSVTVDSEDDLPF